MRCIAHLAEDPGLIAAFEAGDDVHTAVAARTWEVEPADVTPELRSRAKMVAYGLAYGMEAYGLSQRLGIPVDEATGDPGRLLRRLPGRARVHGPDGGRGPRPRLYGDAVRPSPQDPRALVTQLQHPSGGRAAGDECRIQGLAADIFKVALVRLDRHLEETGMASRLILQVHDEVILEVVPGERDEALGVVPEILSGAFDLRVELAVDVATGDTWADAKA